MLTGADRGILRNIQTVPNGPFVGWESLGGSVTSFCVTAQQDGRAARFACQTNGEVWYLSQATPGSWLGR